MSRRERRSVAACPGSASASTKLGTDRGKILSTALRRAARCRSYPRRKTSRSLVIPGHCSHGVLSDKGLMKEFRLEAFNLPYAACEWSKVLRILSANSTYAVASTTCDKNGDNKISTLPAALRTYLSVPAMGRSAFGGLAQGAAARRANRRSLVASDRDEHQPRRRGTAQGMYYRSIDRNSRRNLSSGNWLSDSSDFRCC